MQQIADALQKTTMTVVVYSAKERSLSIILKAENKDQFQSLL